MENLIYLDHAATTPMHPDVIKVMSAALKNNFGNASSIYQIGKHNRVLIEKARETMSKSIQAQTNEIVITSGGTESDNMALLKTAESYSKKGKHIISTNIEHPAVLESLKYLETKGFQVTYLPVNKDGVITLQQVKEAIQPDTILISVMYGNNEIGTIMPIKEIGQYLKAIDQKIVFHTDAVQAYGVLPIDVEELHVDLLSVSAHKMYGPKGIGFLYIKDHIILPGLLKGGNQENGKRAGTENTPAIIGFEEAIKISQNNRQKNIQKLYTLKKYFIEQLDKEAIEYSINGMVENSLPHILNIYFPSLSSDMVLIQMDLKGIALSAGSACTAGALEPSHVLSAISSKDSDRTNHSIRFSFGIENTKEDLKIVVQNLKEIL